MTDEMLDRLHEPVKNSKDLHVKVRPAGIPVACQVKEPAPEEAGVRSPRER